MDAEGEEWKPVRVCAACGSTQSGQRALCVCGARKPESRVRVTWSGLPDEPAQRPERELAEDAIEHGMNSENFVGFARAHLKWSAPKTWIVVSATASDIWLADGKTPVVRHAPTPPPLDVRDNVTAALNPAGLTVVP